MTTPKVLATADCYYLHIFRSPVADSCFNDGGDFWFYNREKSSKKYGDEQDISVVNKHEIIKQQDIIIHMLTNHNLKDFEFGFFEEIEDLLVEKKYKEQQSTKVVANIFSQKDLALTIARIKKDPEWLKKVDDEARKRNIPLNSMIEHNAKYDIKSRNKSLF
jgi:hypothetical protein